MAQFMFLLFPILLFLPIRSCFSSFSHSLCHQDEALALLQFKEMFDVNASSPASDACEHWGQHSYPKMISWNKSSEDCCTWDGVTCHEITGRVIGLDLSCSKLMGVIHQNSSLFQLSGLQKLNLAYNSFNGSEISPNFGGLANLTHLNLSYGAFHGLIPSKMSHLSKLVSLDLSSNGDELGFGPRDFHMLLQNLTHMRVLSLHTINISSTLPVNWSSSLTYLNLGQTLVYGKLPDSIFHIRRLEMLVLYDNLNLNVGFLKSNCSFAPSLRVLDLSMTSCFRWNPDLIGCFGSLNALSLQGCRISGSLPNSFGNLSQIVRMDLSFNNFTGNIPLTISNLPKLMELNLGSNSFTGEFPLHIGNLTDLTRLELQYNLLRGPLPYNVSGLQRLEYLHLHNNGFHGTIPSWLFSLQSLISVSLNNNRFIGQINEFIARLLVSINFSNNQLDGPVPKSISKMQKLLVLDLSSNNLSGTTELTMFSDLHELMVLRLSNNKLSMKIENKINISFPNLYKLELSTCGITEFPHFLKNPNSLEYLDLSNNNLHGQIPNCISLDSLYHLNLSHNHLSSLESSGILFAKNIEVLDLRSNKFQGPLPLSICSLQRLQILDLSHNKFNGTIPKCFGNFSTRLSVLNLGRNVLHGAISMTFDKDCFLMNLALDGNFLEGPLPRSLSKCQYLEVLDFGNNRIYDAFPSWLENLTELQILVLRSNRFFGTIGTSKAKLPFSKMLIFDLSGNEFTGFLSTKLLKGFKAMKSPTKSKIIPLYMGYRTRYYHYSMTAVVKGVELEYTKILSALAIIDLSSNKFEGKIPKVVGSFIFLIHLNLSHNKLSGRIPSALRELHKLESLDLSWNQIEGKIPWELTDLTSLAVLNLSQNRLVGHIPQGKQFNSFPSSSYGGNTGLCGLPLTKNCGETDRPPPLPQQTYQQEDVSGLMNGFTWKSVLIGYGCGNAIGSLMFITGKPEWLARFIEEEVYWYGLLLFRKRIISTQIHRSMRRNN